MKETWPPKRPQGWTGEGRPGKVGLQGRKGQGVGRSAEGVGKQSNVLPSSSLCTHTSAGGGQGSLYPPSTPDTMPEAAAVNGQVSGHKILLLCGLLRWSPPGKHLCRQNTGVKRWRNLRPRASPLPRAPRQLLQHHLYYRSLAESAPGSHALLPKPGS